MDVLQFKPRGIGSNWLRCCACGAMKVGYAEINEKREFCGHRVPSVPEDDGIHYKGIGYASCQADMASFVGSRENGLAVQALFTSIGMSSYLDYREYEPHWVQLKLGACQDHEPFLKHLAILCESNKGINAECIQAALDLALSSEKEPVE